MADITLLRNALAAQIAAQTALTAQPQALDQVSPPVAVVLPGQPLIAYDATMGTAAFPGSVTVNLRVLIIVSAAYTPAAQLALDAYLGTGPGSVYHAVALDPTLGGRAEFAGILTAGNYGPVDYAGETYFGARAECQIACVG